MSSLDTQEVRSRTIVAMFDTRDAADRAGKDLQNAGIPKEHITRTEKTGDMSAPEHEDRGIWEELKSLFIPDEDRYAYSEGVRRGGFLVSVQTDEANYNRVIDILDDDGAVDLDHREQSWRSEGWAGYQGQSSGVGRSDLIAPSAATSSGSALGSSTTASRTASDTLLPAGAASSTSSRDTDKRWVSGASGTSSASPPVGTSIPSTTSVPSTSTNTSSDAVGIRSTPSTSDAVEARSTPSIGSSEEAKYSASSTGSAGSLTGLGGASSASSSLDTGAKSQSLKAGEDEVIPLHEETLRVGKRDVSHGRVRLRTYVVETPVNEQVDLRNERVTIDRHPVDRAATAGDALFQDRTIEAEERAEEAVINKDVRVTEEVSLRKEAQNRTETVSDKVRHTEVDLQDDRTAGSRAPAGLATSAGLGGSSGIASQIRPHMDVIASDGTKIGTVDHLDGTDKIKLTKTESPDGQHHFVPLTWVDHVDSHVHLTKGASDVKAQW